MSENNKPMLEVSHLKQYFPISTGFLKATMLKAVDDISFTISRGETLGLVGESGCGKTTAGRSILQLYKPTDGKIIFDGTEINSKESIAMLHRRAQMVFQDPYSSLNPRLTVADIVGEPLKVQKLTHSKKEYNDTILELLKVVGISQEQATRYPHEFSGGQRQRVGIARALASNPEFIVCDEPVSALDVSIQAQVINMLEKLQHDRKLTYLFIAHDISVVKHISNRIAVMYLGHLVELADANELYRHPVHPYTKSLLSAVPIPDPIKARESKRIVLNGDVPSPLKAPKGCPFNTRCQYCTGKCKEARPEFKEVSPNHFAACHNI